MSHASSSLRVWDAFVRTWLINLSRGNMYRSSTVLPFAGCASARNLLRLSKEVWKDRKQQIFSRFHPYVFHTFKIFLFWDLGYIKHNLVTVRFSTYYHEGRFYYFSLWVIIVAVVTECVLKYISNRWPVHYNVNLQREKYSTARANTSHKLKTTFLFSSQTSKLIKSEKWARSS